MGSPFGWGGGLYGDFWGSSSYYYMNPFSPLYYGRPVVVINNYNLEEDDINGVDYRGFRAGLAYKINDDWDVLLVQSWQDVDADGVFYQHPLGSENQKLNPLEVTLFNDKAVAGSLTMTSVRIEKA